MSRYIDADDLRHMVLYFADARNLNGNHEQAKAYNHCLCMIDEQKTADVVEVVHGGWIMLNPSLAKCSVCGRYESTKGKDLTMKGIIFKEMKRYCPHCGARMDG